MEGSEETSVASNQESVMAASQDIWTPYKELQSMVEAAVSNPVSHVEKIGKALQDHRQNFLNLLKNPPKDAKSRSELIQGMMGGISLPGVAIQVLHKDLVDETIILSDMYDLNEYMALDLLCTAEEQMPHHPGLTRGLVAVLLYYDGRKALVTTLRLLVQARQGRLWSIDASPQLSAFITTYTQQLLDDGIFPAILGALESLDLTKEMELLQKNRALGNPRHHHQVMDLYQSIRQILADTVYLWAAQSGLPKQTTSLLLSHLRRIKMQEDASGGVDNVILSLQMAFLYAIDVSLLRRDDSEALLATMPLLREPEFKQEVMAELCLAWESAELLALSRLGWGLSLAALRSMSLPPAQHGFSEDDDLLIDAALDDKVFHFLHNAFLQNATIYKEEFYLRRLHTLVTDFLILMTAKVKEMRRQADDAAKTAHAFTQQGLEPPSNLPQHFEQLLLTVARLYGQDPLGLNLQMDFWYSDTTNSGSQAHYSYRAPPRQVSLHKFVRQYGDQVNPTLFVPYLKMVASLASCPMAARHAFSFLKQNSISTINWDHFFTSLNRYYSNLRQELPPVTDTVYRNRSYPKGITPHEVQGLQAVLAVIRAVAENDKTSCEALCENPGWAPMSVLLGLVSCSVQIPLKADLLLTLAALARCPATAATLWHNLEASQVLATVPTTSSYQPRGIQTELEELESRNEEFPLTRAMLKLLDTLSDVPVPRLLGVGTRTPGFDPYLTFILQEVFLKFNTRSYKNPQEKWEVCRLCLDLAVKFLEQYEPRAEDFSGSQVELQGGLRAPVNPPPGFHIMLNLCSKSELLRMVLLLLDEDNQVLDCYTVFVGKAALEASALGCLRLVHKALVLQQRFLNALSAANSSLLLTGLNRLLQGVNPRTSKPDYLLNIAKYVTYNSWLPQHALCAVEVLLAVTSHPTQQAQIISTFTATPALKTGIRHAFVECLDANSDLHVDEGQEPCMTAKTKEAICKLLLQCLHHAAPNLAHYLLGFDINKDIQKTVFQQPGILGFPRTCLHSVLSILNTALRTQRSADPSPADERLLELCYRVLYVLAANTRTSPPVLLFLRATGDFLQRHLSALPFRKDGKSAQTGGELDRMSWLLKTAAIELKVTASNQQLSQLGALTTLLTKELEHRGGKRRKAKGTPLPSQSVPDHSVVMTHAFEAPENSHIRVYECVLLDLLEHLDFCNQPTPQPKWEFFQPTQVQQVLVQCEVVGGGGGPRMVDIKRLHHILLDELAAIQGSSTAGQRQLILKEIHAVLVHALKCNEQSARATSSSRYFDAWRQVMEVMLAVTPPNLLPFLQRYRLVLYTLDKLLRKVLADNVMPELLSLTSGAVLLLFVDLRHCIAVQQEKAKVTSSTDMAHFIECYDSTMKDIIGLVIRWILSSGMSSPKVRANLYGALLEFLHLSDIMTNVMGKQDKDGTNSSLYVSLLDRTQPLTRCIRYRSAMDVIESYGIKLIEILCHDCSMGHDVCKMLALCCLDMILELDVNGTCVTFLSSHGYLKYLIDSLLQGDQQLIELLSPVLKSLRPLYVYEAKMSLLCRVASTLVGAELLLEQNALACLAAMQVYDNHPDINPHIAVSGLSELDFIPSVSSRYLQLLSPALALCDTVLSSLGTRNQSAIVQVLHFLLSHGDTVTLVLRSGSPFLQLCYLKELAQLTRVIARATNQSTLKELMEDEQMDNRGLEATSHFRRAQKMMLSLFSRFVISQSLFRDIGNAIDPDRTNPELRAEATTTTLKVAAHLAMYARNLVASAGIDRGISSVVFHPVLLDPLGAELREYNNREANLGVVVQQLLQCVAHHRRERLNLDLITSKLEGVPNMDFITMKELLPPSSAVMPLEDSRTQVEKMLKARLQSKKEELDCCSFIIEHSLYLVWSHLDYYMLRAIPRKTLGTVHPTSVGRSMQMGEMNWNLTIRQMNDLKENLVSVLNNLFCQNLLETVQDKSVGDKGFVDVLLRRIKKLIQFVPNP